MLLYCIQRYKLPRDMYNSIKSVGKKSYTSIQEQTQKTYVKAKAEIELVKYMSTNKFPFKE